MIMSFVPSIVDYSNRQVDVELLQSISKPVSEQQVTVGNVTFTPKIVAGVEKVVQRYASLLMATAGEVKFTQDVGGELIQRVVRGQVSNHGYLNHLFSVASLRALRAMQRDDADPRFGNTMKDERLVAATLLESRVDFKTGTVNLSVLLTTEAGNAFTYVIPVSTAR